MSLIYLLSSLPLLSFDTPPQLSRAKFAEMCRDQLSESDAAVVHALLYGGESEHSFVAAWRDQDAILRNAVARRRARGSGRDASRWLRATAGSDKRIEAGVEDAFQASDPLMKEKALDRLRWRLADELEGYDPLSIGVAFSYAVKLAIAARWTALDAARGQQIFNQCTGG